MTRILLVDDVKLFRHLEAAVLSWRGYTIEEASSGAEAMEKIRSNPPSLVIVDLYMPGMSGVDVCQQVKTNPALCATPVIVVTSSSRDEDIRRAIQAGCDDYLTKPLEDATLIRKVEDLLGRVGKRRFPRVPTSLQISFEDFKGIFFEYTRDISRTGVFVEMSHPLPEGTKLKLSFSLPLPFDHPVVTYGRVVRSVQPEGEKPGGMGIAFIGVDDQSERVIERLVASSNEFENNRGVFSRLAYQKEAEETGQPLPQEPRMAAVREERDDARAGFDELQREHLKLFAILTLLDNLHADKTPKMLLAVALDILGDLLGASSCGIFLCDPVSGGLLPANSRGLPVAVLDHLPIDGPVKKALEERTVQVPEPPWPIGTTSCQVLAAVPILHADRCLGVVTLNGLFKQKTNLGAHDHQLLDYLGKHLGLALINAVARQQSAEHLGVADILRTASIGR